MTDSLQEAVMETVPDQRSLKDYGPYSAYCHICWEPIYRLWIDTESPGGRCGFGHRNITECDFAMGMARFKGETRKALRALKESGDV